MIETFSKNWALYTGISFLTCVATFLPITRVGVVLLIGAYALYGVSEVFKAFSQLEKEGEGRGKQALVWALSFNMADFVYLVIAVSTGIYLGVNH